MKMKINILFMFLVFFVISIVITYPLIFHLSDYILGKGDELLIAWIINWVSYALIQQPLSLFQANIFYPYANTLSFSDPHLTSAIITLPFVFLNEPAMAYNVNLILSLAFLGFSTFLLVKYMTKNSLTSFISALLIICSPFILGRMFQLQVVSIQWVPLSILFFLKFLNEKKFSFLLFSNIFLLIQVANTFLPGYYLILCYLIIVVFYWSKKRLDIRSLLNIKTFVLLTITLSLILIIGRPYFQTSKKFNYVRDIRDTIHFANRPEYFLYPNDKTRLQPILLKALYSKDNGPYKYDGYFGLAFLLLGLFVFIRYIFGKTIDHQDKKNQTFYMPLFIIISAVAFILSLGPVWQWGGRVIKEPFIIPLPYALLYYLIPGFNGIRNSARWEVLSILTLAVIIGIGLSGFYQKKSRCFQITATIFFSLAIFLEINLPLKYAKIPKKEDFPPVYSFINTLPKNAVIIEMPIFSWDMLPYSFTEFEREYFSTAHFRKTVNGYSAFSPPQWEQQARFLIKNFPDNVSVEQLKKTGVKYIVVHLNDYLLLLNKRFQVDGQSIAEPKAVIDRLNDNPRVKLIKRFGNDYVYQIN